MSTTPHYRKELDKIEYDDIYDITNLIKALEDKLRKVRQDKHSLLGKMGLREIKDPMAILDTLGGAISGDYQADVKDATENRNAWFSYEDYQAAYQLDQQP